MKKPYEEPVLEITLFNVSLSLSKDDDVVVGSGGDGNGGNSDWFD